VTTAGAPTRARPRGVRSVAVGAGARLPLLVLPLVGLVAWQVGVWLAAPPEWLLPSPIDIAEVLWSDRSRLWFHARATIAESLAGLTLAVVAGLALAVAISVSRAFELAVYPWVIASQTVPILAVAPLLGVWVGYGTAQILVAAVFCFFPVVVTGVDAFRVADPDLVRAARTMGADPRWIWRHITFPGALPALLSGLKMAAVFAVTGAVVAEYIGADRGLGYLSELSTGQFQTVVTFAAVAWLAVIGIAYFAAISALERLLLPHRHHPVRPRRLAP
jgi:ABC-type nitrate/sulfonate/bicarbonate transport system permease component